MNALHVSEMITQLRCPREWQYAYRDRRVPLVPAEPLIDGTAVHRWLNAWNEGAELPVVTTKPPLRALLTGYAGLYQVPPLQHVRTEVRWQAVVGGVECEGTVDVVGFDEAGDEVVEEHKTTSEDIRPGGWYWRERHYCDPQVTMYAAAFPGTRVLYDVLHKPSLERAAVPERDADGVRIVLDSAGTRVRTANGKKWRETSDTEKNYTLQSRPETDDEWMIRCLEDICDKPEKYYQRSYIVRLEEEHARFAEDIRQIDERRRLPLQPRNPKACYSFHRQCDYFGVCWEGDSLHNDFRFKDQEEGR